MAFSLHKIPAANRDFAQRVCSDLWKTGHNKAVVNVYGDGTESPNGEKFAAERRACSWAVYFDFNKGRTHSVTIELPDECALF